MNWSSNLPKVMSQDAVSASLAPEAGVKSTRYPECIPCLHTCTHRVHEFMHLYYTGQDKLEHVHDWWEMYDCFFFFFEFQIILL